MRTILALIFVFLVLQAFRIRTNYPVATPAVSSGKGVQASQKTKPKLHQKKYVHKYIEKYLAVAKHEAKVYNIPVAITLGQAILESDAGQSRLAKRENNHFGMKWSGRGKYGIYADDSPKDKFEKFKSVWWSYRYHSHLLAKTSRYKHLTKLPRTDYKKWAYGLKRAGYATEPKYAEILISIIERYELYKYDKNG